LAAFAECRHALSILKRKEKNPMKTAEHQRHIQSRVSHNNCQECRADCERQFLLGMVAAMNAYRFTSPK
jgi:hypothetical protein